MDNVALAHKLYDAMEVKDVDTFRSCFSSSAMVWHNYDDVEQPIEEAVTQLQGMLQFAPGLKYSDRRYMNVTGGAVLQHVSHMSLANGQELVVPIIQRIYIENQLIERIEEYMDTTALKAAMGA